MVVQILELALEMAAAQMEVLGLVQAVEKVKVTAQVKEKDLVVVLGVA
jgi:hypothetical protein